MFDQMRIFAEISTQPLEPAYVNLSKKCESAQIGKITLKLSEAIAEEPVHSVVSLNWLTHLWQENKSQRQTKTTT